MAMQAAAALLLPRRRFVMAASRTAFLRPSIARRAEKFPAERCINSKQNQVSKLCKDIDERVNAFLDRLLEAEWPYLWLYATYLEVRTRPKRLGGFDNRCGGIE